MSKPDNGEDNVFYLEDILKEFGGWSTKPEPPKPEPPKEEAPVEMPQEEAPLEPEAPPSKFHFVPMEEKTKEKVVAFPSDTSKVPEPPVERPRPVAPVAEPVQDTVTTKQALEALGKPRGGLRLRVLGVFSFLWTALTLANGLHFIQGDWIAITLLGGLFLSICLGLDVMMDGVIRALTGKPSLETLLAVATIVFTVQGLVTVQDGIVPYTALVSYGLLFGLKKKSYALSAKRMAYKQAILAQENGKIVTKSQDVVGQLQVAQKGDGDAGAYGDILEKPSAVEKTMAIYGIVAILLSLVVALVSAFVKDGNFLTDWAAVLAGALPFGGFIAFWKPFYHGTRRIAKRGSAMYGYPGIKALSGRILLSLEDEDLFPGNCLTVNGIKTFSSYTVSQVVGYANAIAEKNGGGLERVFAKLQQENNGYQVEVGEFARYDGGLGGEIQGDVVLLGTMGFMQLMRVQLPEGTNLRQAIYCAINGELVAVFALNYTHSAMHKTLLGQLATGGKLRFLLSTLDFIINPASVRQRYHLATNTMEFPQTASRAQWAGGQQPGTMAGTLSKEGFVPYGELVLVSRNTFGKVQVGLAISLLWGILGIATTISMVLLGAGHVATAFNVTAFATLWSLAQWLLTAAYGRR